MTEGYQPYPSSDAETEYLPPVSAYGDTTTVLGGSESGSSQSGSGQGTAAVAKDQAAELGKGTVQAGQHVASVAKDQAANVTAEAGRQAKDLLGQARSEVGQQVSSQQQRLADGLKALSQQLHSMADNSEQSGLATDLARQGGQATEQVASWFDGRDPGAVLQEVRSFARRRPGAFLLMAAGAGLLAGRLTRGLKDEASGGSDQGSADQSQLTSGAAGAGAIGYPETGGLTTGSAGLIGGDYAGSAGYATGGAYPTGGYGGVAPVGGPIADEPVPFAGPDGTLDYPTPGEPR